MRITIIKQLSARYDNIKKCMCDWNLVKIVTKLELW